MSQPFPPSSPQPAQNQQQPPFQQQPQSMMPQPAPKKKRSPILFIILGVVALVLFACIGGVVLMSHAASGSGLATVSNTPADSGSNKTTSSPAGVVAKVGQTINVESVSCTLASVTKLPVGEYDVAPKAGHEYIAVHVILKNTGDSEQSYNPFDFHVKSGMGDITDGELAPPQSYKANNLLSAGTLAAGGTTSGDIIFQVPVGDHAAQLTWKPTIFDNSTQYAWSLGL